MAYISRSIGPSASQERTRVPFRKVTGEVNPRWSPWGPTMGLMMRYQSVPEAIDFVRSGSLRWMNDKRDLIEEFLLEEQERTIDEYCGLKEPSPGVKWPPQYPLDFSEIGWMLKDDVKEAILGVGTP